MSTFGGHMREYVDISLDRFDDGNLDSTVYFLSHKHEDHMVGLSSTNFQYRLNSNSHIKLYVSEVTRDLLLADDRFTGLAKSLVVHEIEVPCSIPVPDPASGKVKYHVTVTLVPAAHCPGSVMFLFEGQEGTALYTGDFRFARGDITGIKCLKSGNSPKPIDSLYIDTTFCVPEAFYIPSREACVEAILRVVGHWTALSPNHMVLLYTRAALGYEHLFVKLAKHFDTKIHLSNKKYDQCKRVKAFPEFGTCDGASTQIHACKGPESKVKNKSSLMCKHVTSTDSALHVKRITVSTMWFTQHVGMEEIIVRASKTQRHHLRACYSFHSSYSEVRDVVTYLNPRRVFPNVIPMGHTEKKIQDRLNNFLKLAEIGKQPSTPSQPRLLGKQRVVQKRPLHSSQSTDSDLLFDDSPRKPKKQKMDECDAADDNTNNLLSLKWDASQSTEEPNSQPNSHLNADRLAVGSDADADSSYLGSQQSNASAMDLVATDIDVTPKKTIPKDLQSTTPDSIECIGDKEAPGKVAVNGVAGEKEHSDELISGDEVDKEVLSVREMFKPYKDGSYGSHVTYASDVDFSGDDDGEDECDGVVKIEDVGGKGDCKNDSVKEHITKKCQNGQCFPEDDEAVHVPNGDPTEKHTAKESVCAVPLVENALDLKLSDSSKNQESSVAESSDKSLSIEETTECLSQSGAAVTEKITVKNWPDDDDEDDVIMLDSDEEDELDEEEGEVPGAVAESMSEGAQEKAVAVESAKPQPSTCKEQEVIDLTAEDDEEIVSMGVSRFHGEEGDGYHGDSESEVNDTDGIMTDSDSSFAKASYEKTKTRMSTGKSRRATVMNGFSSSDSDSDTDVTIDESLNTTPMRYPIAGSCHYSKTRLNGFYSTLIDNEVIVLDDKDDEPPPNVTVVDIAIKDQQVSASKSTLASAEDLVSGAMAMASAATAANNSPRLISTIQRLKKNINKPVLVTAINETCKQTARKSTSAPRFSPKKSSINKSKVSASHKPAMTEIVNNGEVVEKDVTSEIGLHDIASSEAADNVMEISQSHQTECSVNNDSGKIDETQQEQPTLIEEPPVSDQLR